MPLDLHQQRALAKERRKKPEQKAAAWRARFERSIHARKRGAKSRKQLQAFLSAATICTEELETLHKLYNVNINAEKKLGEKLVAAYRGLVWHDGCSAEVKNRHNADLHHHWADRVRSQYKLVSDAVESIRKTVTAKEAASEQRAWFLLADLRTRWFNFTQFLDIIADGSYASRGFEED